MWGSGAAVADPEVQSSLVEDFAYPGADAIFAEHGLRVFAGDGHVEFLPVEGRACAADLIQVTASLEDDPYRAVYCFRTSGTRGFLTMEVPHTFLVRAAALPVRATATVPVNGTEGETEVEVVDVPPNRSVPIEPGGQGEVPPAVLVELRFGTW
ncbi:hypothetical protein ACFUMH_02300 [Cellulomonas sp. NPDC057328]|uniref:hypothetical protein n=1 Tax=Cellulomonas sp. NPDC057328 TaxID=3346101 RepID=UPI003644DD08